MILSVNDGELGVCFLHRGVVSGNGMEPGEGWAIGTWEAPRRVKQPLFFWHVVWWNLRKFTLRILYVHHVIYSNRDNNRTTNNISRLFCRLCVCSSHSPLEGGYVFLLWFPCRTPARYLRGSRSDVHYSSCWWPAFSGYN